MKSLINWNLIDQSDQGDKQSMSIKNVLRIKFSLFLKKNGKALKPLHSCKVFWFSWGKKSFFIIVFLSKILAAKKKIIFQAIFQKIKFLHFNFKMILPKINHFLCYWVVQTIFPKRKTFLFLLKAFNPNFALGGRETGLKPWNWISKESLIHPRMLLDFNQSFFFFCKNALWNIGYPPLFLLCSP